MRYLIIPALAALSTLAQTPNGASKPPDNTTAESPHSGKVSFTPGIEQLQAKIALLEAQLDAANKAIAAEHAACWTDDLAVANARWVAAVAQKKAAELGQKQVAPKQP